MLLIGIVLILLGIVSLLIIPRLPKGQDDVFASRGKVITGAILFLITGLFLLYHSF